MFYWHPFYLLPVPIQVSYSQKSTPNHPPIISLKQIYLLKYKPQIYPFFRKINPIHRPVFSADKRAVSLASKQRQENFFILCQPSARLSICPYGIYFFKPCSFFQSSKSIISALPLLLINFTL